MKLALFIFLIISSSFAGTLFKMDFQLKYKNTQYHYKIDIKELSSGGIESISKLYKHGKYASTITEKIRGIREKKTIAVAPFRGFDLLYLIRLSDNSYALTYPVNMLEGDWKNLKFKVAGNMAFEKDLPINSISSGKVNYEDKMFLGKVPVGVNELIIQ